MAVGTVAREPSKWFHRPYLFNNPSGTADVVMMIILTVALPTMLLLQPTKVHIAKLIPSQQMQFAFRCNQKVGIVRKREPMGLLKNHISYQPSQPTTHLPVFPQAMLAGQELTIITYPPLFEPWNPGNGNASQASTVTKPHVNVFIRSHVSAIHSYTGCPGSTSNSGCFTRTEGNMRTMIVNSML